MAMFSKPLRLAPVFLLIAACDTVHPNGSLDPGFGETARYNAALQTIDPDPRVVAGAAMPGDNGARGAAAGRRYRTDTVKPIERIATTSGTSSGPQR